MPFFGKVRDRNYEEPATPFSNKIRTLKSQLQRELDNSRARAEGQDTSEIATADIADRIITIGVVEEIEQVSTKL
jgi:hypothetical protein